MTELPAGDATAPQLQGPRDQVFPGLTPAQLARVAARGRRREIADGEVLVEAGDHLVPFFVVARGEVEIVQPSAAGETVVTVHHPGEFTGEVNMLSGRRSLVQARAKGAGVVVELDHEQLLSLVHTDGELGEIIMRAFILRRLELIANDLGDVVLIGSQHSAGTLRIKEFLSRNGNPYAYIDLDTDTGVQELFDRFGVTADDVPVVICRGDIVLRNPENARIAACLGLNAAIDQAQLRDVVVVGAGPAGLAAAVYAASEGLDVLVIEANAPGGQAGTSSRIENYLGFPTGISGQKLAARAYDQAQKFGAQVLVARGATALRCDRRPYVVELDDGPSVSARTIIIATGAEYRQLPIQNLARFHGSGVYYAATAMEAELCRDQEVIVVGGGNSAGQAAVFLSRFARRVRILVRGDGLAASMSRYLIRRIEGNPAIELKTGTEVTAVHGDQHLERVTWRETNGASDSQPVRHLFMMTGAVPATGWLQGCVATDASGFIRTGPELQPEELAAAGWPGGRAPFLLETSLPGVFAVGDVRGGNVKRVASAVGEGSIAVAFVHQVLHE